MSAQPSDNSRPEYLTPVIFHTLLALSDDPKHGYAISQEVAEVTEGRITMGPGTLYGTLQRLRENGWLQRTEVADAEGPHAERRRYYELTPSGRAVLREEARRLERGVELAQKRAILKSP
jgi:DNA-binding PadR family transcriptional regulator